MAEKYEVFADRIKKRRHELGMKRAEICAMLGIDLGTYGRWERGETKPLNVYQRELATALQTEVETLFAD